MTGATGRTELEALFLQLINDNIDRDVTSQDVRDVLNALKNSNLNLTDDDAFKLQYPPSTPDDWGTGPTNSGDALDSLAKNSILLNFSANTDNTVSNIRILQGEGVILNNATFNSNRLSNVTYETSDDNITWSLATDGAGPGTDGDLVSLKEEVNNMGVIDVK